MEKLTREEEQELIKMYKQVEEDFKEFPEIKTTEDLFRWREKVKAETKGNGELRNTIIEEKIKGNNSMELLYAWSKFTRIIDKARANVFMTKLNCDLEDDPYQLKPANTLHKRLTVKKKANPSKLFGIYKIKELSLGLKYPTGRSFHTPYEYEAALTTEDEEKSWPADLFVVLMNAYGIEAEDLLESAREVEQQSKEYIADITVEYEANKGKRCTTSPKIYGKY